MIGWLRPRAQRYRFLPDGRIGGGALPWVIGMMTFLAALALAGGIALSSATMSLTTGLSRSFTVQIIEPNPDIKQAQAAAVLALLRGRRDVTDVHLLARKEMQTLLEPWLGAGNIGEELPLPAMIDAAFARGAKHDTVVIETLVKRIAPTARVDDHAQWFAPLAGVVNILQWLAIAIGALVAAATAAIVALSVRSAISTYGPTIETLHMMGAEDRTIAALFEYRYAIQGLAGGLTGFFAALAVILLMGGLLGDFGGGLAGEIRLPPLGWLLLLLLPLLVMLLTLVTARLTVGRALQAQL